MTKPSTLFDEKVAIISAINGACSEDNKTIIIAFNIDNSVNNPVMNERAVVATHEKMNIINRFSCAFKMLKASMFYFKHNSL